MIAPAMSALEAIQTRRSVRRYEAQRLDRDTIQRLLAAAVRAPTAIHEEQWVFVVLQGRQAIKHLSERLCTPSLAEPPPGAAGSDEQSRCLSRDADINLFHDADTLILICAQPMGPFVPADCWLAAGNLMLAAHALGLGSCVVGSAVAGLNTPEHKRALGISEEITVVAPIVVGVPFEQAPPTARAEPVILAWTMAD
ncbi:nitroreductase family protein [Chitinimonas naiadis]